MAAEIPQPNNKRARELLKLTIEDISNVRPQGNLTLQIAKIDAICNFLIHFLKYVCQI